MKENDRNFLREYHFFTAHHLSTVAKVVVERMRELRKQMINQEDNIRFGDELSHLLAHLHIVNYMQVEATCAILYALVNRENGIVSSVLSFDLKKHKMFVDSLEQGKVSFQDLGVIVPEDIALSEQGEIADAHLRKRFEDLVVILRNTDIRRAYNKLKHCGIVVRCPELLSSDEKVEEVDTSAVYIPTDDSSAKKYSPLQLQLTKEGNELFSEERYLEDITFFGTLISEIVKYCDND